jgi:hypothetical protein
MATYPLVGLQNDLGPLVKLSLLHHNVPVTAIFDVLEEGTNERFLAVATPLVEQQGLRAAYMKIFTALERETFSTNTFLRLHTLVLSSDELQAIRHKLKGGVAEASLPKLAHLNEVVVHPTEDPKNISRSGMLHISPCSNGAFLLSFGPLGSHGGAMKSRTVSNFDQLKEILRSFKVGSSSELHDLKESLTVSILVTSSLENLYKQGLI